MRAWRAGQAARAGGGTAQRGGRRAPKRGRDEARSYARYPRYPQAESAWCDSESVTASRCGRDDLPATEESLPSHSPGGRLVPSSDWRPAEADGRAADEAAAMRTRTGLPFSGCDGGRLREAPIRNLKRPSGTTGTGTGPKVFGPEERTGGTPDLRIQDQPGRKRCLRTSALPPAQKELRFRRGRAGPASARELRTGMDPRLRLMAMSGGTRASARDPAGRALRCFGS